MTFCEANLPVIHFEEYYNNFRKQLLGSGVLYTNVNLRFIKLTILKHLMHFIMLLYTDGIDISLHVIDISLHVIENRNLKDEICIIKLHNNSFSMNT